MSKHANQRVRFLRRFPGQASGDFKIPSAIWYTQDGEVRCAGAEARDSMMRLEAEDDDLVLAEWCAGRTRLQGIYL